ncbi:MMPL family transporter [Geobacter sp. DSM 9736]|uniref:MMPL family transporter n=1 Tax=Geobacter sp. DSM 9736 TaxID=1277350 RepID=UPI000B5028DE|nr:MMPL family transporter [Geobacter sp. DSM 9736]SNB44918.1 hypothetical protein SAMN06269301_0308 [Geobacter sp. DSM 9736]
MIINAYNKILSAAQSSVQRHLEWIFRVTTGRPVIVFASCCLLFLLSCISIARTHFESDIFKMFPQTGPLSLLTDTLKWTGSAGNAYFLLEGEKEEVIAEAERFAAKLRAASIEGLPAFSKVKYRVFDPAEASSFADFIAYAVTRPQLFLDRSDLPRLNESLSATAMKSSLEKAKTELSMPGAFTDIIAADPLYLRDLILPRLKSASQALDLDTSSPYFLSRDGKVLIIIAEPSRPVTDIGFARKVVGVINEARKDATVSISCAGAHISAVTDEAVLKENIIAGVISSLIIVLVLFYASYRRFLPTLLIPLILLFGVVLAVGTGGLFYPSISIISFAFTSLIIGLGTDYSIHLYDRFHFERSNGRSSEEALRFATVDTGYALFTAALTTALPFLALSVSDLRILAELGLLVGLGVIYSLYATYFFLPPLLLFMEKKFPLKEYKKLPGFGLALLWRTGQRRYRLTILLSLTAVLCLLLSARNISFESELKNLQPEASEAFQAQEKVEKHLSVSPKQLIVAVEGADFERVMAHGSRVEELARGARSRGEILSFSSLGQVLNEEQAQRKVIEGVMESVGRRDLGTRLTTAFSQEGFALEPFEEYISRIAGLPQAAPIPIREGVERLARSPFHGIVERHLIQDSGGYHLLTYLNYRGAEFRQNSFLQKLQEEVPGARATSVDLVSTQLVQSVKASFRWAIAIGGIMLLFLLVSHFTTPVGIFYSLFPIASGGIAMLGIMALCDMRLNFMNVMVLVTVLGMGSDYGLHVAHRVRNCQEDDCIERFVQSGRAVFLSALTTIAAFGSLAFTEYGALASIGWATNFGIAATTLFTLFSLPAFMRLWMDKKAGVRLR